MKLVIDTSVLAKAFLDEPDRERCLALIAAAVRKHVALLAPTLILYELNNALVSKNISGEGYDAAIMRLFGWLRSSVLVLHEADEDLLRRAEVIASLDTHGQGYISSFDATFHALAMREDATFVTSDAAYVRKTRGLLGRVELLNDVRL